MSDWELPREYADKKSKAAHPASSHLTLQKGVTFTMQVTKDKVAGGIYTAVLAAVIGTGTVISHAHAAQAISGPSVLWGAPRASNPTKHTMEQQIQGQLERLLHGYNTRNISEVLAVLSPDCISTAPGQTKPSYPYKDAANSGRDSFARLPADANMKAKVNSCRIDGNTAVLGLGLFGHGTTMTQQDNGPVVYYDNDTVGTMTFVNTGGQWRITHEKEISHTKRPYHSANGNTSQ
jgi:hypothetical protein